MPPAEDRGPAGDGAAADLSRLASSVNSVLSLSLILAQMSTPAQAMRLVTTAVPSIAASHTAVAWHPGRSGSYFEQAPEDVGRLLAGLTGVTRLSVESYAACWAFPITSLFTPEPVFLVVTGSTDLSGQEAFLLSILAQLCGTVIASLESIATERERLRQIAALNAELEATVSALARLMEIHRSLTGIVASGGQAGIAATLHQLTGFPVLIVDAQGHTRMTAGPVPGDYRLADGKAGWAEIAGLLRTTSRAVYRRRAWLMPAMPQAGVLSVIALVDPARSATETDRAAVEHAATVLSVELARLQSVAEAELRGQADREREVAQARASVLAVSEARQRTVLEAALDAVISIDQFSRVTYVNSAFERTFGYRADEVIGRDLAEKIVPPSLREAHRLGLARYLETGQGAAVLDRRIEMPAMRADGTEFPAEVAVTRTGLPGEAAFTAYVRDIADRRRAEQELMASRARLVTASDAARQRMTRDLHDGAQQHLVNTLINLQLAEQSWAPAPARARELLRQALGDTRRGIENLRELAAGLHPAILTQHGLAPAVRALADRAAIPVEIDVPAARLPSSVEASLYFFCSEALTNIAKHAQASRAWVRLEVTADRCVAEVRDDGVGGARPRSQTSGLIGLSDRLGAIGGTLDIDSPPSGGTVLRASVPLRPGTAPGATPRPLAVAAGQGFGQGTHGRDGAAASGNVGAMRPDRGPDGGPSPAMLEMMDTLWAQRRAAAGQPPPTLAGLRAGFTPAGRPHPVPGDVRVTQVSAGGVPAHWLDAPGADSGRALLFLHGGGYELGSLASDGELAARLGRAAGMRVLFPEYRLAPEHRFPAAIDDALAAWRWLRAQPGLRPRSAAVAGDSAGGGLATALLTAVRDAGEELPAAAVLMSPTVDLTSSGASMTERADQDPVSTPALLRELAAAYLNGADPRTPLASPLFAALAGLPPLLIQVGTADLLLSDAERLAARATDAGVDVTLHIGPGLPHVYPLFAGTPEAAEATAQTGAFLRDRVR